MEPGTWNNFATKVFDYETQHGNLKPDIYLVGEHWKRNKKRRKVRMTRWQPRRNTDEAEEQKSRRRRRRRRRRRKRKRKRKRRENIFR